MSLPPIDIDLIEQNTDCPAKSTQPLCLWNTVSRGGSLIQPEQSDELVLLTKLRNIIRSILDFSESKAPSLAQAIRSLLRFFENITGIKLLPDTSKSEHKKKGSSSRTKRKTKVVDEGKASQTTQKKKTTIIAPVDEQNEVKTGSVTKTIKGGKTTEKGNVAASKSTVPTNLSGKQHLTTELKSSNPNHRIQRELKEFLASPPPNLSVSVGKNIRVWIINVVGAKNTIYEGETYKLRVSFPDRYPVVPPSVYFLKPTPRHEHVYTNGDICLSLLGKDWRPTMTAQSIAVSILSILSSAKNKSLPMDNSRVAGLKPGQSQENWVYHDDNC